jgi:GT2 family glycosyltransferase
VPAESRPDIRKVEHSDIGDIPRGGQLEVASLVGSRALVAVVAETGPAGSGEVRGWLAQGESVCRLRGSRIVLGSNRSDDARGLLILHQVGRGNGLRQQGTLVIESPNGPLALGPNIEEVAVPIGSLGSDYLSKLDAPTRTAVLDQMTDALGPRVRASAEVSHGLRALRDAVRPRLPPATVDPAADYAAHVDGLWRVDSSSFYIKGWIYGGSALDHALLVTPEGRRIEILRTAFRHSRADVSDYFSAPPDDRCGFIAYVETPEDSVLPSGWILELGRRAESGREVELPAVVDDPIRTRTMILHDLQHERLPDETLRTEHVRPALTRLERRRLESVEIDTVDEFGAPHPAPEATIVVPLYRSVEYLEHQMAQFVRDPSIRASDLVYVLDSPEDADRVRHLAEELFPLYGVPFRLLTLSTNGGFALANNLGASVARGRMLLLMNSDVLPDRPGWLPSMVGFYDTNPTIGALGPKLLYEDESIQHAGLYFDRPPGAHVWSNEHYFKGLHRDFPAANIARAVPAVTGACMMIGTHLYYELGGLSGEYIRGDYEDSDLCLRLRDMGREAWYLPDVELYHLEGQSYPTKERRLTSEYNKWLHTHMWRQALQETHPAE